MGNQVNSEKIKILEEKVKGLKEKTKDSAKEFNKEARKATNTAIVAAFSFLIALSWKDVITLHVNKLVALSPAQNQLISAAIITIICVTGIIISSKLLSVKE